MEGVWYLQINVLREYGSPEECERLEGQWAMKLETPVKCVKNLNFILRLQGELWVVTKDMISSHSHFRKSSSALVTRKWSKFEMLEIWWWEPRQEISWTMRSNREDKKNEKGHREVNLTDSELLMTSLDLSGGQSCPCPSPDLRHLLTVAGSALG